MKRTPQPDQIWMYTESLRTYKIIRQVDMKTNNGPTGWEAGVLYEADSLSPNVTKMFCRSLVQFLEKFVFVKEQA